MSRCVIDDTLPLFATIDASKIVGGHIEYQIKVQRGQRTEENWTVSRRYTDFAALDNDLKVSGFSLTFPPKKAFGNMSREFIAERMQKLQVFLHEVLANWILANSLSTKQLLCDEGYSENFQEQALQHISMLLRSEPTWEVVEPLGTIGSRIRKTYCLVKNKSIQKTRYMLTWCSAGPYASIEDKERITLVKSLENLQHANLLPVHYSACSAAGAMVIRPYMEGGSLRDMMYKVKPKTGYLKKCGNHKSVGHLALADIKKFGRQILEVIKYMTDKGFPMGHVHLGNVFIEDGNVRISDIENFILGVPPAYRTFATYHRKCNTLEALNAYSFGHLLYQMKYGCILHHSSYEALPGPCAPELESILFQLLTFESLKSGIPSIEDLLNLPFFAEVTVPTIPKPVVKIPSKLKECLRNTKSMFEETLKEEQRVVAQIRKRNKVQAYHMTDEEKRKRKQSQKKSIAEDPTRSSLTEYDI
ncbi:PX domain-containing protein kinase-like protein isoform X2 [Watersipora subatra]|uniref:PX domain-containing protein kinase-like protein isoform X2 n=1 Tax=Watersipora subatra TaxID=2589382 RepID=UPI00355BACF7